ncbi:P-type conjugative transfer protein TrbG [Novosphingobium sp. Gsoil 351]|uniref:P-type conjugative transfer protein TrbG n=1 Tax=Novosphingobium sp. Gsoil 351 TaxID=2675225 RepID=UPI0012B4D9FA|nr:P-type conjugative transfer protein TrbG [Novosphingobium sp. Gsoil 351]QGN54108.1 P-type conjugative transfer protein TrbG [Novosphingobium sp. Gsoil 351]
MIAHRFPPLFLVGAALAWAPVPVAAKPAKPRPAVAAWTGDSSAVRTFAFTKNATYSVVTAPGRVTDIALEPGETLGAVASGDTARWVIGDTTSGAGGDLRAHVLVKPVDAGLSTNLVITTNRRVYHLLLTSGGGAPVVAVSWTYPADALLALRPAPTGMARPIAASIGVSPDRLNFGYAISGDKPTWRPLRVFDDGRQTFIEFPASLASDQAPPLFVTGSDGSPELVNYRLIGRHYIVDRLFDAAELRLGTKKPQKVRIVRAQGAHDSARKEKGA